MLDGFKGFIGYTEKEFEKLWEEAIFVVDTNILINFYKYTSKVSTNNLLDILKKLKQANRLWVPHQVALEYFFNYEKNMFKPKEGYDFLGKELKKLKEDAEKILLTVESKHPYIMTDKFHFLIETMQESNHRIQEQLDKEIENLPDSNKTKKDILDLLVGIVGKPYSQEEISEIEKNGEERYLYNIPPGFEDKNDKDKAELRSYGGVSYQRQYGDLIVWQQIIDKAKEDPTPIIMITEDRKKDWWEIDKGKIKRPHPQLLQEFINETQQDFYMFRTDSFVRYAIQYLDVEVSDQQAIDFTFEIENIRKSGERNYSDESIWSDNYPQNNNLMDDFNIEKLMEYLSSEEQKHLKVLIGQAFTDGNLQRSNAKYNEAIYWAILKVSNKLEEKFNELIGSLALMDYNKIQSYLSEKNTISDNNKLEKGILYLKNIEKIEEDLRHLDFMKNMPF